MVPNTVAHVVALMTDEQKNWSGFDRWYRVMMDFIVFGPATDEEANEEPVEEPIVVED